MFRDQARDDDYGTSLPRTVPGGGERGPKSAARGVGGRLGPYLSGGDLAQDDA